MPKQSGRASPKLSNYSDLESEHGTDQCATTQPTTVLQYCMVAKKQSQDECRDVLLDSDVLGVAPFEEDTLRRGPRARQTMDWETLVLGDGTVVKWESESDVSSPSDDGSDGSSLAGDTP